MDQESLHVVVSVTNAAFTAFRIAAHVPQLIAVVRDPCGARAISVGSWVMFAIANLSNGVYALVMAGDRLMFGINLISSASCVAIASVAGYKQRRANRQEAAARAANPSSVAGAGLRRRTWPIAAFLTRRVGLGLGRAR